MGSDGRLRTRCRITTALCCTLAPLLAVTASPAHAADECGPVPPGGGTIECPTADYPDGISYDGGVEDLTVVVDPGSTLEGGFGLVGDANLGADLSGVGVTTIDDFEAGVSVDSTAGDIGIRVGDVSTSGDGSAGVYARGTDYTLIYSGNVTTSGDGAAGLQVIGNSGYQVIVADFTQTTGEGSTGVSIGTKSGDIFAMTFGVETSGDYSDGVQLSTGSGDIVSQSGQHIILGQITTHGNNSDAIDLSTVDGHITSRSQDVITFGDLSDGIHAVSGTGNIAIYNGFDTSAGLIETHGLGSDGIYARTSGDVAILSDTIHVAGGAADAIDVASDGGSVGVISKDIVTASGRGIAVSTANGGISIDSGTISGTGYHADAIQAVSFGGNIAISSDAIDRTGNYSDAIWAQTFEGSIKIDSGDIAVDGFGSRGIIALSHYGNIDISTGDISTHSPSFIADGIYATTYGGAVQIETGDLDIYGAHSNAIFAYGESGVTITTGNVNTSHVPAASPMYNANGIAALSPYGDVSVVAGNINTQGFGVLAEAGTANIDVAVGDVITVGDYGSGVQAITFSTDFYLGSISIQAGDVHTDGYRSAGLYAFNFYAGGDAITFDTVETLGDESLGVGANGGLDGDVVISGDAVHTVGSFSPAVFGRAAAADLSIDVGTINTDGDYGFGIVAVGVWGPDYYGNPTFGTMSIHTDSVETQGNFSSALFLRTNAPDIEVDAGHLETHGDFSTGLYVESTNIGYGGNFGFQHPAGVDLKVSSIETYGNYSTGIYGYFAEGNLVVTSDSIRTHGNYSSGILVESDLPLFGEPTPVDFAIDVASVETEGNASNGIVVFGNTGPINITNDTIETHGQSASGIVALGLGSITIDSGSIALQDNAPSQYERSTGLYAISVGGNVSITSGDVTTEGTNSSAIIAASNGRVDYYGNVHVGDVSLNAGEVTTKGDYSIGVAATSSGGSVNLNVGSVETNGDYSIGIAANALAFVAGHGASNHTLYGGDLTVIADDVTTTGDHSDGVSALGFSGGNTSVTVGTVETNGDDSYGVNVVTSGQANSYTGQFYGGSTAVTVDKVTTTGDGSNGVRVFAFTGDVDLTVGSVDVSGENSDAVIGVNGSDGSVVVNILDHAISQHGFGVAASAYDDVDVNIAEGARVFGGSVGVYASAYYDGASALITNFGEIATDGNGIAILAIGQGITIDNSGAVIGPVRLTGHRDVFNNVGTWQSFGANQFGFGNDTVLNTGRLIIGAGQAGEQTDWSGLETLDNRGLITMADGHADQVLNLERAELAGGAGSKLAIDVAPTATGLTSDLIKLGIASGSTELQLNGIGGLGKSLVVDANASSSPDNFFLAGGAADLGLIRMTLDYDSAKSNWSLVGSPDQEAFEGVRFGAQIQSLWRRTVEVWSQTMNEGPTPERVTIWGHYLTGHENQDLSPTFTALGADYAPSLDTDAKWDGAVLGASFGHGGWRWGALAGFTKQTTRFTFDDNKLRAKGANFGAYADWRSDKFFARAIADYQHAQAKVDLRTAAISDTVHGSTFGVRGEAGFDLAAGALRIEPLVSVSWTRGHLDALHSAGANLDFHDFTSLEGSAGATFSGVFRAGATAVHPYAGLYAVHEFSADNALDLTVGSQSLRLVDQPRSDYAKAMAGFAADLGGAARLSVGGEVDAFGGRNAVKGLIGLSWHG